MISRRVVVAGLLSLGPAGISLGALARDSDGAQTGAPADSLVDSLVDSLADLERRYGGRLGVAVFDTGSGHIATHRGDERFALCSTFKVLAAGYVLARVDRGEERLDRRIAYDQDDLVDYSPATGKHVGDGMRLRDICEAAVTLSDNTAANLMLASLGGPAGLTAYLRSLGDDVTRLDRREPQLNYVEPGDPRDTTTPVAMLHTLRRLVLGRALSVASRDQLQTWLRANQTGDKRLRAGLPAQWRVGDKTGTGPNHEANDIAVVWPPERAPLVITAYYVGRDASDGDRDTVLAEVGRLAATL
ncbi:class A beta-lactamase [Salinisphaera aquimarina]|uniref:Beta-lactamase n=1 Tax=Salinisphaera aquimarina TaxID=2094031 RepID=A0ABV7EQX6_9GAMM